MGKRRAGGALVLLATLAGGCCPPPPSCPPPLAAAEPARPPHPAATAGEAKRITTPADIPLQGHGVDGRAGDYLLVSGDRVAVIDAAHGRLVDFARAGGPDGLLYVDSVAFDALSTMDSEVEVIEAVSGGRVIYVRRRVLERPLILETWYRFDSASLVIESQLTAAGKKPVIAATLGEAISWGNFPSWVAGHGFIRGSGAFGGDFIARESAHGSYALCSAAGRLMTRIGASSVPGFYWGASTGEVVTSVLPDGPPARRTVHLSFAPDRSLGHLAASLPCVSAPVEVPWPAVTPIAGLALEAAACDALEGDGAAAGEPPARYSRFRFDPSRPGYSLPRGCFRARLTAPGHAPGSWFEPGQEAAAIAPTAGTLRYAVVEGGEPLPAKILVRGIDTTADPDWGEDSADGAQSFAYSDSSGAGSLPLPAGKYRVSIHRGPEYSAHSEDIEIRTGQTTAVSAELRHVVDTTGWISADLHVHALPSPDAPTLLTDRVRSLAAVQVEVAVATDHNAVTDYRPAIEQLRLQPWLTAIVGDEVTSAETYVGHFNVFPLQPGSPPLAWEDMLPSQIFEAARARAKGPLVVQVNHPRMGSIGYFELLRLDAADVAGWQQRAPLADMSFDAIELFNGDHYADVEKVKQVMRDWYALLNAGRFYVATGNSDSHKVAFHEAGFPRNWVQVGEDDPAKLSEQAFIEALKAGRVIVSSGPFLTLTAAGQPPGSTVAAGPVELVVQVDAPSWIDVDEVALVVRGKRRAHWQGPWPADAHPRFRQTTSLKLEPGDWVIAVASGSRPMEQLYRKGATPFAFTNPIRIR